MPFYGTHGDIVPWASAFSWLVLPLHTFLVECLGRHRSCGVAYAWLFSLNSTLSRCGLMVGCRWDPSFLAGRMAHCVPTCASFCLGSCVTVAPYETSHRVLSLAMDCRCDIQSSFNILVSVSVSRHPCSIVTNGRGVYCRGSGSLQRCVQRM